MLRKCKVWCFWPDFREIDESGARRVWMVKMEGIISKFRFWPQKWAEENGLNKGFERFLPAQIWSQNFPHRATSITNYIKTQDMTPY